jgi:hypothetical protein
MAAYAQPAVASPPQDPRDHDLASQNCADHEPPQFMIGAILGP